MGKERRIAYAEEKRRGKTMAEEGKERIAETEVRRRGKRALANREEKDLGRGREE